MRAVGEKLIVLRTEADAKTKGGIIIPDGSKEKMGEGTIVAVGEKAADRMKVGDFIIFGKYTGTEVEVDGQKLLVIHIDEVLVVR